jgi:phosphate-selective porin OprO/OprP
MRLTRLRIPIISGGLGLMWCLAAAAQESLPSLPDPAPPATAANPAAAAGAAGSREAQLEEEVRQLKEMVRQLSTRVEDLSARSQAPSVPPAPAASGPPAPSGLAGPGGVRLGPGPSDSGLRVTPPDQSRVPSGGTRELPNSQLEGNRRLGQIPLRTYLDYGLDGVGFATEDEEFQLRFRILEQIDYNGYLAPQGGTPFATTSGFYLPRSRYYFQGQLTKPISYDLSFQRSYSTFNFFNAFMNFNYDPRLQIRIGRQKVPFTYEFYKINVWRLIAPERSVWNNNYQSNRDIGIAAWGGLFENRLEYAVMLHNGPRNGFQAYDYPKTVAAFLNFKPFQTNEESFLRDLNIGGSLDYGYQNNPAVPLVFRTNGNASNVALTTNDPSNNATLPFLALNNNVVERGLRDLWELHAAYYYKGLSVLGAWDSGFNGYAVGQGHSVRVPTSGYFVQVAYLITGETVRERTVIDPISRFDLRPGKFGLGALEPHARYSEMFLSRDIFTSGLADPNLWTNRVQLIDVGVNWYLNKFVKIYFDWEHAIFASPVFAATTPNGKSQFMTTNDLLWLRFQFYY